MSETPGRSKKDVPGKDAEDYAMTPEIESSYQRLRESLGRHERLAIAFSGGVDSTLLLAVAHDVLGNDAVAFTASSRLVPRREFDEAMAFCRQHGIDQVVFESEEFDVTGFSANPPNRCYLCKRALFDKMSSLAGERGIADIVDGTNLDDLQQYRPGQQAKDEYGVQSSLADAGLDKRAIRALSKKLGLATYAKQSFACLASRIPYGTPIDKTLLSRIDDAESYLLDEGFNQVRVRVHGDLARIEMPPTQFPLLFAEGEYGRVVARFKSLDFLFVTLDLEGYRTGSMDEALDDIHSERTL